MAMQADDAKQRFDYIFDRAQYGAHLWFGPELIRQAFAHPPEEALRPAEAGAERPSSGEGLASAREAARDRWVARVRLSLCRLSELHGLEEQRRFIADLPADLRFRLCYYYFEWLADRSERVLH